LLVTYEKGGAKLLDGNRWYYQPGETLRSSCGNWVYLRVVRLPPGAILVSVNPPADEIRSKEAVTLYWQYLSSTTPIIQTVEDTSQQILDLPSDQKDQGGWQVAAEITYQLHQMA
jgi:hypothetical protein